MGLDIYTHRLTKTKSDNFFGLDDKQIAQFKKDGLGDFICTKEEEFLDFPAYFGVTKDEYYDIYEFIEMSWSTNEEEKYSFIDKKNIFYNLHQAFFNNIYCSKELILVERDLELLRVNHVIPKDFDITSEDQKREAYDKLDKIVIVDVIITSDFPKIVQTVTGVYYKGGELAYQRKGLTQKYYEDYNEGKFDFFVTNKAVMQDIYDNYVLEEYKDNFKELLDSFVQGETVAIFSW